MSNKTKEKPALLCATQSQSGCSSAAFLSYCPGHCPPGSPSWRPYTCSLGAPLPFQHYLGPTSGAPPLPPHSPLGRSRPGPDRGLSSQAHSTSAEKHAAKPPDSGSWLHLKERTFSDGNPGPETCLPSVRGSLTPHGSGAGRQGGHRRVLSPPGLQHGTVLCSCSLERAVPRSGNNVAYD